MSEPTRPAVPMPDASPGPDTLAPGAVAVDDAPAAVPADIVPAVLPLERRLVLRAAGVAGMAGVMGVGLVACSSSGGSTNAGGGSSASPSDTTMESPSSAPSSAGASSAASSASGTALGATSQIPVGGGMVFADQKVVVTQPAAGTFKGFSSTCTHAGCQVNKVSGGVIMCPCHGSEYSITDGSVKAGPAPSPLPAANVTVQGSQIFLSS